MRVATMEEKNYLHSELSGKIIKAFYNVYNTLGYGFLEKVYENALMIELQKLNLKCVQQQHLDVYYEETKVGDYFADIIVEDTIIVELKAAESLAPEHEAQLVNYLRATDIEVGLLFNFGKMPQHKRKVLTSEFKKHNKS
jgi:GxxExxY protein